MQFYEKQMIEAVKALNNANVSMLDVPEDIRRETFNLEPKMAIIEKKGDVVNYMAIVAKWRDLFMACKPELKTKKEKKPWQKTKEKQTKSNTNTKTWMPAQPKSPQQANLFPT